ncbi:MAG TPA: monofunctional biosynthetic peptidoglycan transglycosylase [Stellaceae bacterium]|nr:monofunctional biosynthetic peptidoglycan transglycosylase [Stellaceae bacterium]
MTPPILAAPPDPRQSRNAPGRNTGRRRAGYRDPWRRARRIGLWVVLAGLLLPMPFIIAYRFVPPPITALMAIRSLEGAPLHRHWLPLDRIAPSLMRAVVASEDEKFCFHHGFDWQAIGAAWRDWRAGREPKGASTISMQTAKNLFLWPGRSILRKGIEAYLTVLIELFWDKHRIIETYLNVIEWGDGIYGAETASRIFFGKPAARLSPQEAALLAAVLPNPRRWSPARPDAYIAARAATIRARMADVTVPGVDGCR